MRTLYLDCSMGAAGDTLTAALLELLPDQDAFIEDLNRIGIPDVCVTKERIIKCGIGGTHVIVEVNGTAEETEIAQIVCGLKVSEKVRKDILGVCRLIAEAEGNIYGVPVPDIHFHELGTPEAVTDIAAVCLLMEKLAPQRLVASPIHVGSGHVKCTHGILPVPTPVTAYILRDIPIYGGSMKGELCTPTGAALLKYFAASFEDMPVMKTTAIGYGMGKNNSEAPGCVRAMLGETADSRETVYELNCNVDDMTAEEIGFAMERLLDAGALEVFTVAVGMKKSRPGTLLRVLCREESRETIVKTIFQHTTTIGVREIVCGRYVLDSSIAAVNTPYGKVRRKDSVGYGVMRSKLEYDDLARIARERELTIDAVRKQVSGTSPAQKEGD